MANKRKHQINFNFEEPNTQASEGTQASHVMDSQNPHSYNEKRKRLSVEPGGKEKRFSRGDLSMLNDLTISQNDIVTSDIFF